MLYGAALVVLCAITAANAAARGIGGSGTAAQDAGSTLHFVWAVDGGSWHDQTIGSTYGPPSMARFATSAASGWGIAYQGASSGLHFIYAVDGQPWVDQTIGSAYGPPSIARFSNAAGSGWGVAVQGANDTLHFVWAVDGGSWHDQAIGSAYGPPSIVRFSNADASGWGIAVQAANNTPPGPVSNNTPSGPVSTPLPQPKRRHSLHVKLVLTWRWRSGTTWLDKATIGRFPAHMGLTMRCRGRRCPRHAVVSAAGTRHVRRLLRVLRGQRYEVGDRLRITLTAPGFRPEVAEVIFRYGRLPAIRLLSS